VKRLFVLLLLVVSLPLAAAVGPEQLIRDTSDKVIAEIKANGEAYRKNPDQIYKLVEKVVLPHFDFSAMTDLALGNYRDQVSAEQRPTIVNEFRALLVRTYSSALLEYTDQELTYLPMQGSEADGEVLVKTEIAQQGGFPIPIDYRLKLGENGWKVFDISVDEVSLVTNYRSSFARAIKKDGVDGLIRTLQDRNRAQ
jgi:phospholipid transport system substrate-binding protein